MHVLDEFGLCAATIVRLHAVNHIDDRLINIERSIFQTRILTQMIWTSHSFVSENFTFHDHETFSIIYDVL